MSERNACVFCINETDGLPNGDGGFWCQHFQEPIMGQARSAPSEYSGRGQYSHSGRARDHQDHCAGFSLDPQQSARWKSLHTGSSADTQLTIEDADSFATKATFATIIIAGIISTLLIMDNGSSNASPADYGLGIAVFSVPVAIVFCIFGFILSSLRYSNDTDKKAFRGKAIRNYLLATAFLAGLVIVAIGMFTGDWPH